MIGAILALAARLEAWIGGTIGRPYRSLLGIGLVIEIVQRLRDLPDLWHSSRGLIGEILAVLLFAALLLNQLSEMHERVAARRGVSK